jgi:hypothetical protein
MGRRASMTVTGKAKVTPVSPTADEPSPTGGAAKSGQYPGLRQNVGEPEGQASDALAPAVSVRGVDPALAGDYVHTERSMSQGRAPGKEQLHDPQMPVAPSAGGTLGAAGGQFPGIPVQLTYGEGFDALADSTEGLAGATKPPQAREGMVGVSARHYPGVPQVVEGLAGAGAEADTVRSISNDEGVDINVREVGTTGNVGARHVAPADAD